MHHTTAGLPRVMALLQQHGLEDTLYWLHSEPGEQG